MMVPLMTDFEWRDGERMILFGETALDHLWDDAELLTTERAQADVPPRLRDRASAIRYVPAALFPTSQRGWPRWWETPSWWRGVEDG